MPIPSDLYQAVFDVGYCAVPLRNSPQMAAKLSLIEALATEDTQAVLDALRDFSRAFRRDVAGRHIPARFNGTVRKADMLIGELEQLADQRQERAA